MFKQPKIFMPKGEGRAYILYYFNGKRIREYNGNRLGLNIHPNRSQNPKDKKAQLIQLQHEFARALNHGWSPLGADLTIQKLSLRDALAEIISEKQAANLSDLYVRNLIGVHRMFVEYLPESMLKGNPDELSLSIVEGFLNRF